MTIREIKADDNKAVEKIIRDCLIEFGANHAGTVWVDDLSNLSAVYSSNGNKYWVAENNDGKIVGGCGIGQLKGEICELQKMYCISEARGTGIAHKLIETALNYAKNFYGRCYLETLSNMTAAQKFYEKYGFVRVNDDSLRTAHVACDLQYIKNLR